LRSLARIASRTDTHSVAQETLPASAVAGAEALRLAKGHLSARRPGAAVLAAWGERAAATLADAKAAVRRVLAEYYAAGDVAEACRALSALRVPFFAHEFVLKALTAALEAPARVPASLALLAALRDSGAVSTQQMARGFGRTAEAVEDLSLDVPDAKQRWAALAAAALTQGLLRGGAASAAAAAASANGAGAGGWLAAALSTNDASAAALAAFKAAASDLIWEYFAAGSRDEAASRLCELLSAASDAGGAARVDAHGAAFVRRLVLHALDRGAREREAAAALLSALVPAVLPRAAVTEGFMALLRGAEDTALDVPDAPEHLLLFTVRAVVDDVLPPAWPRAAAAALAEEAGVAPLSEALAAAALAPQQPPASAGVAIPGAKASASAAAASAPPPPAGSSGAEIARAAAAALSARHVGERALRAWGGPDAGTLAAAKTEVTALLSEFVTTRDAAEAQRRLRELHMPFFGHECVKRACGLAIERGGTAPAALLALLGALRESGAVSATQMAHGFARAAEAVDDLSLDVPDAKQRWAALARDAAAAGLLRAAAVAAPPL
jgi:hypothetical protein